MKGRAEEAEDFRVRGDRGLRALTDTDWVGRHLGDADVRVVQVDEDPLLYELGHLPGAVMLRWDHELQPGDARDVVGADDFAAVMGRLGVRRYSTVVLYGDKMNGWATYAYWVLKYWGHPDVRIMDGGHQKWSREGRPLTTAVPVPVPVNYNAPARCPEIRAYTADVVTAIDDRDVTIIDARSEAQYDGALFPAFSYPLTGAHRGGHVPGAVNVPWTTLTDEDGCFRADTDLRDLYAGAGVELAKLVLAYCIIGIGSSSTYFTLRELLGVANVRNYDGSWLEWGSTIGLPVERRNER